MKKTCIVFLLILLSFTGFSQTAQQRENKLLGAIGLLTKNYLYNTYLTIGAVADGSVKDVYGDSLVVDLMNEQISIINSTKESFNGLITSKSLIDKNDEEFIKSLLPLLDGLAAQAKALIGVVKTGDSNYSTTYSTKRKENWKRICEALDIPYEEQ